MRIPVLKYKYNETINFDISVNNILGISNTKLLETYSKIDPIVKNLGKLVKFWAKQKGIISKTCLSSYALILMTIYFLQHEKIIPSLQKITQNKKNKYYLIQRKIKNYFYEEFEARVDFEDDLSYIRRYINRINNNDRRKKKKYSIFSLFRKFLQFYSKNGKVIKENLCVDIKNGIHELTYKSDYNYDYLFSIPDPFDDYHDPGVKCYETSQVNKVKKIIDISLAQLEKSKIDKLFCLDDA